MLGNEVAANICSSMTTGYDLDVYKNDSGEVGGYIARSQLEAAPLFQYDAAGTLVRKVDLSTAGDHAEQAKATMWRKDLEAKFPHKENFPCRSVVSSALPHANSARASHSGKPLPSSPPHTWNKTRVLTEEEARQDFEQFEAEQKIHKAHRWQDTATFLLSAACLLFYAREFYPSFTGTAVQAFAIDPRYLLGIAIFSGLCLWIPSDWVGAYGKPSPFRKLVRMLGWIALTVPGVVLLLAQ
jgi:hypothetical protein